MFRLLEQPKTPQNDTYLSLYVDHDGDVTLRASNADGSESETLLFIGQRNGMMHRIEGMSVHWGFKLNPIGQIFDGDADGDE